MTGDFGFFCSNEVIRLDQYGTWWSDDVEIDHEQTLKLFFRSIYKENNSFFLKVGNEKFPITVDDTPVFVTEINGNVTQGFKLKLSDGTQEILDPTTLNLCGTRLTCKIRNATQEARFTRTPYLELLSLAESDENSYFICIQKTKVALLKK